MSVTIERHIDDRTRLELVELYAEAFEPLRTKTATKQTLAAHEFSALLDYDSTVLFLGRGSAGAVTGFAVGVGDLKLIPWINPEYFHERFPEHSQAGRLAYMPTFLVHPEHQKGVTLLRIAAAVSTYYGERNCVLAMDCCQHNIDVEHFPSILARAASRFTPTTLEEIDRQVYWAYILGEENHPEG